ncbi:hypothetical protein MBLNU230_g8497t1 [Neophaeotheca triangularis]
MATSLLFRRPLATSSRYLQTNITTPIVLRKPAMSRAQHTLSSYLVPPSSLAAALKANPPPNNHVSTSPRTIPLCGSWFLPNDPQKRTGISAFKSSRIPTARFFDLDKIAETSSPYPHMLPTPGTFATAMSALGIRRDDVLVVYDTPDLGIFSAPRVAWTLRLMGHPAVHILNNYKLWCEQSYPTESGEPLPSHETTTYPVPDSVDMSRYATFEAVKELAQDSNKEGHTPFQIVDARSAGRFSGADPEPRPGLSSGHIPGSINVPLPELLDPETKAFKSKDELRKVFESKGFVDSLPTVTSCGTGVMAAALEAAVLEAGYGIAEDEGGLRVYDGSWTEWAQRVGPTEGLIVKD